MICPPGMSSCSDYATASATMSYASAPFVSNPPTVTRSDLTTTRSNPRIGVDISYPRRYRSAYDDIESSGTISESKKTFLDRWGVRPFVRPRVYIWYAVYVMFVVIQVCAIAFALHFIGIARPLIQEYSSEAGFWVFLGLLIALSSPLPDMQQLFVMVAGTAWGFGKGSGIVLLCSLLGELVWFFGTKSCFTKSSERRKKRKLRYETFCRVITENPFPAFLWGTLSGGSGFTLLLAVVGVEGQITFLLMLLALPRHLLFVYVGKLFATHYSRPGAIILYIIGAVRVVVTFFIEIYTYIKWRRVRPEVEAERAADERAEAEAAAAAAAAKAEAEAAAKAEAEAAAAAQAKETANANVIVPDMETSTDGIEIVDIEMGNGHHPIP